MPLVASLMLWRKGLLRAELVAVALPPAAGCLMRVLLVASVALQQKGAGVWSEWLLMGVS